MIKQNVFKTIGFLALSVFAAGILFLSVRANQVQAHELTGNSNPMMGQMMNSNSFLRNHSNLTSEQRQEMINLMQKHHGDNWQNHHQQMHGSDSGIQKKGGGL